MTQSQVSVLSSVERLGSPTLGELAASEKVQPPSMTRQVDALVAAGLLAREVHDLGPQDREGQAHLRRRADTSAEPVGPHGVRGGPPEAPSCR